MFGRGLFAVLLGVGLAVLGGFIGYNIGFDHGLAATAGAVPPAAYGPYPYHWGFGFFPFGFFIPIFFFFLFFGLISKLFFWGMLGHRRGYWGARWYGHPGDMPPGPGGPHQGGPTATV